MSKFLVASLAVAGALWGAPPARADTVDDLLAGYRAAGSGELSAARGQALWRKPPIDAPRGQDCTGCHTANLRAAGRHAKTGQAIEPMAPSANPKRLSDAAFIEKWFRRNCKGTWGRECTPQEKGDFLMFLRNQ